MLRYGTHFARRDWGLPIRDNPLAQLRLKAPDRRRERRLRDGELAKLLESAGRCRNPLIAPIIRIAHETGMRRGEILAIRKSHIDLIQGSLLIPETKNGHSRTIPLTKTAIRVVSQRIADAADQLFPIKANAFRLAWERLKRRAGISDLHFHDLRHEAISRFFEKGLTVPEVQLISGHRDARMLFRYAHAEWKAVATKLA